MAEFSPEKSLREIDRRISEGTFKPTAEQQRQIVDLRRQVAQRGEAPESFGTYAAKFVPRALADLGGGVGDLLNIGADIVGKATGFDVPRNMFFGSRDIIRKGEETAEQLIGRRVAPEQSLQRPAAPQVLGEQGALDQAGNILRAAALPTGGALAGQAAGTAAQPVLRTLPGGQALAAAAPVVGESIGSGVGYISNVLAGNESFSWNNLAASLALPGVTRGAAHVIGSGAQALVTSTPGESNLDKIQIRGGVPILSKAGRYNVQEEIKSVRRRANANRLDDQQRLNAAFDQQKNELVDLVQKETGLPPTDFTDLKTGSVVAKAKQQGAALELIPRIEKRMREALEVEEQLGTFTGNVDDQVREARQILTNISRQQDFDARDLRKSYDEYVDKANRNALREINRREQLSAQKVRQFSNDVNAHAPTDAAVQQAFADVEGYADLAVPRGLFTKAQRELAAAQNLLQENFPGPQNSEIGSRLRVPTEPVPAPQLPPNVIPGPGYAPPAQSTQPLRSVPFAAVQAELKDLGQVISGLKANIAGAAPHPAARQTLSAVDKLYSTLQETLDIFVDNQGNPIGPVGEATVKLRYANELNKKKRLAEELTDVFNHSIERNDLGQNVLSARKAKELLVKFNDNDVARERLQQTGLYGPLISLLDNAAKKIENANRLHERLREVTRLPDAPELVPTPGATPTAEEIAGRNIQESAARLGTLERQVRREDVPKEREPVQRPGSGGEIYRAGLQGGAIVHALSNSGSLEAAVISGLLLPGHLGYLATTPRGRKLMLDLIRWNGGVVDDKVSGIVAAAVRAGVSGYLTEEEREALNAAASQ